MWVAHFVRRNSTLRPDAIVLADERLSLTWRELDERTDALATALRGRGLGPGDRALVASPNRVEVIEMFVACAKSGVIVCPVNPSLTGTEVEHIVANCAPQMVFTDDPTSQRLGAALGSGRRVAFDGPEYQRMLTTCPEQLPLPSQDDCFAILHTSATTGWAKGVAVTHRSIAACYTGMAADSGFCEDDVMINSCPLFHGSMVIGLAVLAAGGMLVLNKEFSPQRFLAETRDRSATRAFLVPAMVRFAMRTRAFDQADLSSLTEVMYGGAPMPDDLLAEAMTRFQCAFRGVYGITEGGGPIATVLFDPRVSSLDDPATAERRLRSAGRMLPGCHIEILDSADSALPPGEIGEVCVRGDGLMTGYWHDEKATQAAMRNGWLHTGDLGYSDAEGYLYLIDRINDVVIRGGQNIYPAEVERVLCSQLGVVDAAVVGAPSAEWGEVPVAFVVAEDSGVSAASLLKACSAELASYKRPIRIEFVPEIPRSVAGKILRRLLRQRLTDTMPGAAPLPEPRPGK